MLRSKLFTPLLAAALLPLAACSDSGDADPDRTITAGFYPLAWLSAEVAGEEWHVENLTGTGSDPHELSIGLAETARLEKSRLVVISTGLQPAVDKTVETVAEGDVLDAVGFVDLVPADDHSTGDAHAGHGHAHGEEEHDHGEDEHAEEGHEEEGHEGHDHGDFDPHFWHDPVRMAALADAIADELSRIDPDGAAGYEERAAGVRAELEALDAEFIEGLATCERHTVVVTHDAFGYLGRYGLDFESITGLSPGAEASPAVLGELERLIRRDKITTVFSERLTSAKMAQTLADDLGVTTAVLDPIEGLTDETADEDYLSLMRANLAALRKANGCQ